MAGTFSQLGLLSTEMILGPGIDGTVQADWIVLDEDLVDDQSLWWIYLEHCGAFGK